jgi:hypothetical protein
MVDCGLRIVALRVLRALRGQFFCFCSLFVVCRSECGLY